MSGKLAIPSWEPCQGRSMSDKSSCLVSSGQDLRFKNQIRSKVLCYYVSKSKCSLKSFLKEPRDKLSCIVFGTSHHSLSPRIWIQFSPIAVLYLICEWVFVGLLRRLKEWVEGALFSKYSPTFVGKSPTFLLYIKFADSRVKIWSISSNLNSSKIGLRSIFPKGAKDMILTARLIKVINGWIVVFLAFPQTITP